MNTQNTKEDEVRRLTKKKQEARRHNGINK